MAVIRQWLDHRGFQPAVFRSTSRGIGFMMRIEFVSAAEANEFAQAFDGTVVVPAA
jgi:hypothetical protein